MTADALVLVGPGGQLAWNLRALVDDAPADEGAAVDSDDEQERGAATCRRAASAPAKRGEFRTVPSEMLHEVRRDLRAALAAVLIADYRADLFGKPRVPDSRVKPVNRSNPGPEES